ncbi:MAG: energy transducer TonB [Hymenobacter sp.]|nr:MAG: energy transducer TonB [Hymenobacter sp.]
MRIYIYCLAVLSLGLAGSATAQQAPAPSLAAVVLPEKATAPAAPAPRFSPDSIFINPQVRPQFTGGDAAFQAYLQKNLRYPAEALRQHVTGKVLVSFVLSATGLVTYATVLRGPTKDLNAEALRLIWHMPPWQPARQHGQPVRVSCTIPVNFVE